MSISSFSVDVEDWFHILDLPCSPPTEEWLKLPSRVEANFSRMLEILAEHRAQATCFFLGWVAERFPHLVTAAAQAGHEIASHGWAHQLAYSMSRENFREDARRSRKFLEDVTGQEVWGYRAPGFSCTADTPWFFEELVRAGYRYDSSVFPAERGHGGMRQGQLAPYSITTPAGELVEFPATVANVAGRRMCFFGGGYLRLFPLSVIRVMARRVLNEQRPVFFYVHPREIDPEHPRLPMSPWRRFKSYVNLATTEPKIHGLLEEFPVATFRQQMEAHFPAAISERSR